MSDRHDLRRQTREIREALSRYDQEQLIDILTHVFRQYIVDGAAPAPASAALAGDELAGLSFPQLIERLQLRLDLPELSLFEVQGQRLNGVKTTTGTIATRRCVNAAGPDGYG